MSKDLRRKKVKKRRILKTISIASLAVVMATAGILAFAPIGASASPIASGLVAQNSKDPIIYSTEFGLDIKLGLSLPDVETSLTTDNLKGFPYFTTTSGSNTYTWVIIGRATDVTSISKTIVVDLQPFLFSNWRANSLLNNRNYFFNNIHENSSPAGNLIEDITSSKTYVIDSGQSTASVNINVVSNAEIPSGCVLCYANTSVGTTTYEGGNGAGMCRGEISDVFSLETLGLDIYRDSIVPTTVSKRGWNGNVATWTDLTLFVMGYVNSSFHLNNYLTATQRKESITYWTGDWYTAQNAGYIDTSGNYAQSSSLTARGCRPAFVLSLQ